MSEPFPPRMDYDPDASALHCDGSAFASVYDADDFPCLDPDEVDLDDVQAQIDATGRKLALAYNAHDALVGACESVVEALSGPLPVDPANIRSLLQAALDVAKGETL